MKVSVCKLQLGITISNVANQKYPIKNRIFVLPI